MLEEAIETLALRLDEIDGAPDADIEPSLGRTTGSWRSAESRPDGETSSGYPIPHVPPMLPEMSPGAKTEPRKDPAPRLNH